MSELRFDGQVAVVTGAGRGLGRAEAIELARRGAKVLVNDNGSNLDGTGTSTEPAADTVEQIRSLGGDALANFESVAADHAPERIIANAIEAFGRIDILISNAGNADHLRFEQLDEKHLDHMWRTHLYAPFLLTMAAWPHFKAQRSGVVLLTSSSGGLFGDTTHIDYAAAKAGLIGLTRSLVPEAAEHNVRVNMLCPCAYTRMVDFSLPPDSPVRPWFESATPERDAQAAAFLVHDRCPASGEIFGVYGGHVIRHLIGSNRGYVNPTLSAEDVRDNWEQVMAIEDLSFSPDIQVEFARVQDAWRAATQDARVV